MQRESTLPVHAQQAIRAVQHCTHGYAQTCENAHMPKPHTIRACMCVHVPWCMSVHMHTQRWVVHECQCVYLCVPFSLVVHCVRLRAHAQL